MLRLDAKLAKIRCRSIPEGDFIIADAKDVDMANPITGMGPIRAADGSIIRYRTRSEFLDAITQIIRQDQVDIMLLSASNLEVLKEAGVSDGSAVKPAFRANDTTDIWSARIFYVWQAGASGAVPHRVSLRRVAEAGLTGPCPVLNDFCQ